MHIYSDYITPLITWLHIHPNYALIFAFLTALLESIAIIGTIIPGSLTMTAIGILAGSGVMRFDLTIMFSALGAFVGDSSSYILGAVYSENLSSMWPFSRYPSLLHYGQEFFNRHGGKSVLIGRFTGPLRSITPIIAGMMHMPRLQFFLANFISAFGWAILYLVPGYIIGAAANQLSTSSAQRLFAFVLGLLVTLWILSILLKTLAKSAHLWLAHHRNMIWIWTKKHPYSLYIMNKLSSGKDAHQQRIISLLGLGILCFLLTTFLSFTVAQETWIMSINQPITLFLQTIRTSSLDAVMIMTTFLLGPLFLSCFAIMIGALSIYSRDWRFLKYWGLLILSAVVVSLLCAKFVATITSIHLFAEPHTAPYPVIHLSIATAFFVFLNAYMIKSRTKPFIFLTVYLTSILLLLSGFATLYLGDNWFSSVLGAYGIGLTIGLTLWILYQRKTPPKHNLSWLIILSLCLCTITTCISQKIYFQMMVRQHTPNPKHYTLNQDTWWYQDEPILPMYSTNRVGKRIGVFNIQYAGSIKELEKRLETCGWKKQPKTFIYSLIIHAERRYTTEDLPFMEQLYLNRHPALTMSYHTVKDDNLYILRLWRSNYHLMNYQDPIWLGNIILARKKPEARPSFTQQSYQKHSQLFTHILPAVHDYQITRMPVKDPHLTSLPYEIPSELLIIKN